MEQDSVALVMIIFEFFAQQDGESNEAWVDSTNQAIAGGIDGVLNFDAQAARQRWCTAACCN